MTVTTTKPVQPKPTNCDFQIVGVAPAEGYEEIALLSQSGGATSDPTVFKEKVRADVCRVGGDVVVTRINGFGDFLGGSVLRRISVPAPKAQQ